MSKLARVSRSGAKQSRKATRQLPRATLIDMTCARIEKALKARVRYRYVHPEVMLEGGDYVVTSPCCSRNVDPDGGVIDIAKITPLSGGGWLLSARDHEADRWVQYDEAASLSDLLEQLCLDSSRVFWP